MWPSSRIGPVWRAPGRRPRGRCRPGGSAAVSTNSRHFSPAAACGTTNCCGWSAGVEHEHHGSGGRVGRGRWCRRSLVRLGPLAFQSTGLPSGPYQLTSGSWPGFAAVPVRNAAAADVRLPAAERDQRLREAEHLGVLLDQPPIEPADLVVLAVGVVVAALRAAALRRRPGSSARPG